MKCYVGAFLASTQSFNEQGNVHNGVLIGSFYKPCDDHCDQFSIFT